MSTLGKLTLEPLPGRAGAFVLAELGQFERSIGAVIDEQEVTHNRSVTEGIML